MYNYMMYMIVFANLIKTLQNSSRYMKINTCTNT